jgi:hypothetical protein
MGTKRQPYRILHIPTGEIFTTTTSHSKNIKQFKEEFRIILDFAKAPIECDADIAKLHSETLKRLLKLIIIENIIDLWNYNCLLIYNLK